MCRVGVGMTLEVRLHMLHENVKMMVEGWEKIVRYVSRGGESEYGLDVGVTLEVRLYRFFKMLKCS